MVEVYVHYFLHIGVCGSGQIFLRQIWIIVDASTRQPFMFCSWMLIWLLLIMLGVLLIFKRKNINCNNHLFINNTFFTKESKNINCNLMTYQLFWKNKTLPTAAIVCSWNNINHKRKWKHKLHLNYISIKLINFFNIGRQIGLLCFTLRLRVKFGSYTRRGSSCYLHKLR